MRNGREDLFPESRAAVKAGLRLRTRWRLQWAGWLMFLKRHAQAQRIYEAVLADDSHHQLARGLLASALAADAKPAQALEHLRYMAAQNPAHAPTHFNTGFLLEQAGALPEAESAFRRALELDPRIDRAWYGLALVLIKQNRLTEALAALHENTRLQPFSPYGWYQLAMTHHHLGNGGEAARIRAHLAGFEPRVAAQLGRDLGMPLAQDSGNQRTCS
jgi:tetratricopeptide (TPR) repeat protein